MRVSGPLLGLLAAASLALPARAGELVATVHGPDVVLDWVDPATACTGNLYRAPIAYDLTFNAPYQVGAAAPVTVPGDGQFLADGPLFYGIAEQNQSYSCHIAFRLERTFTVVPGFQNIYYISLPLIDTQADVASTGAVEDDKCVGDAGGPAAPDGLINADDFICQWWTGRQTGQGSMMLMRRDSATATWRQRAGMIEPSTGAVTFAGSFVEGLVPDEGLMVTVDGIPGTENRSLLAGGHSGAYLGRTLSPASGDTTFVLSVPYHTIFVQATEILCGIEGVDWCDCDSDGWPDTCGPLVPTYSPGIFDGQHPVSVETFDNVADGSATDNSPVTVSVSRTVAGTLRFTGVDFRLHPGEAYVATISPAASPVTFLSPHW